MLEKHLQCVTHEHFFVKEYVQIHIHFNLHNGIHL